MADQGGQGQGHGPSVEKSNTTQPIEDSHFVSGLVECEKKTVTWEINNVSELMEMSQEKQRGNGIHFEAGQSFGIPATWSIHLVRLGDNRTIAICFKLSSKSEAKLVNAGYSITLSSGGEVFAAYELGPKEFKPDEDPRKEWDWGRVVLFTQSEILQKTDGGKKPLRITLRVKVFSNKGSATIKAPKAKRKEEGVISDFQKLLESEDGADVDIRVPSEVGGELEASSYAKKVHKGILMARSSVFAKMFSKESKMVEAQTGVLIIKDLSPKGLDIFLHYLYTGKVLKDWVKVPEEILNAAEKYDLGRLKKYCGQNIKAAVTTSNALALHKVAKLHKLSFAKGAIEEFIHNNTKAVLNDGEDEDTLDVSDEDAGGQEEVDDGSEFA